MTDHSALPTRVSRFGDLCAWLRKMLPTIVQETAIFVGWIAFGQILLGYEQWIAGVWATLGGPFVEVLVLCWRWMCDAWPDLHDNNHKPEVSAP